MKILVFGIILSILLITPVSLADELPFVAIHNGTCRDFTFDIATDLPGCWDVKVDAPGQMLHNDAVWKNNFFYVKNAVCNHTGTVDARLNINQDQTVTLKFRQGEDIHQFSTYIRQDCPQLVDDEKFFYIALLVIIIIFAVIFWYWKKD